ncbi:hypothetical protein COOONC_17673 [Cooperia oncophora]
MHTSAHKFSLIYIVLYYPIRSFSFRFGLNSLRSMLTGERIQKLFSELEYTPVTSFFVGHNPENEIETDFKLKEALMAMGVTQMFSGNADLTGISKAPPLHISTLLTELSLRWMKLEQPAAAPQFSGRKSLWLDLDHNR